EGLLRARGGGDDTAVGLEGKGQEPEHRRMVVHQEDIEDLTPRRWLRAEVASVRHLGSFLVHAGKRPCSTFRLIESYPAASGLHGPLSWGPRGAAGVHLDVRMPTARCCNSRSDATISAMSLITLENAIEAA